MKCQIIGCPNVAEYKATGKCNGARCDYREYADRYLWCQKHLDKARVGNIQDSKCNTDLIVKSWDTLTKATEDKADIRIGDEDRGLLFNQLSDAFAGGFIDLSEFNDRSSKVYAAKTHGELELLTKDLPEPKKAVVVPSKSRTVSERAKDLWPVLVMLGMVLIALLFVALI